MSQTQKYLDEATAQLSETTKRTAELRELNDQLDFGAREEAKELKQRSQDEAEQIVLDARAAAKELLDEAEVRTRALVADAEDRLSQIRIERDAVAGYFESLRGVLTQAERVTSTDE